MGKQTDRATLRDFIDNLPPGETATISYRTLQGCKYVLVEVRDSQTEEVSSHQRNCPDDNADAAVKRKAEGFVLD